MFGNLKDYAKLIINENRIIRSAKTDQGKKNFIAAELIRNTHSIEKGLSISNPRLGFGHAKQQEMMDMISVLFESDDMYHKEACSMAISSLTAYIDYHEAQGYSDEFIPLLKTFLKDHTIKDYSFGGVFRLENNDLQFDIEAIERFFRSRHSIRDFSKVPVGDDDIRDALILAQTAPSACNRQGVRAYVLSHDKSIEFGNSLPGIGGFAQDVDRFIMITGKTTSYRSNEVNQYIVSASIYAAYLSLTLHLYGIGSCVVQHSVTWNERWENTRKKYNIPNDEQIVLLLAIGNIKDVFLVPLSHRLDNRIVAHFIE